MKASIKILETNQQIQQSILKALLPECDKYMERAINQIKKELPNIISIYIQNSSEYYSLVSGSLRLELGIPDANTKVAELIQIWINNIEYFYEPPQIRTSSISSKIMISAIKSDFSDVLGSNAAYVIDNARGYSLPWLEWLLLDGTKTIVQGEGVFLGPSSKSRTGMAIMKPSPGGWKVPPVFSGTISDNWITRAIDNAEGEITDLLKKVFQ